MEIAKRTSKSYQKTHNFSISSVEVRRKALRSPAMRVSSMDIGRISLRSRVIRLSSMEVGWTAVCSPVMRFSSMEIEQMALRSLVMRVRDIQVSSCEFRIQLVKKIRLIFAGNCSVFKAMKRHSKILHENFSGRCD